MTFLSRNNDSNDVSGDACNDVNDDIRNDESNDLYHVLKSKVGVWRSMGFLKKRFLTHSILTAKQLFPGFFLPLSFPFVNF